jgi:hypothetical protein
MPNFENRSILNNKPPLSDGVGIAILLLSLAFSGLHREFTMNRRLCAPAFLAVSLGLALGSTWARADDKKMPSAIPQDTKAPAPVLNPAPQAIQPQFDSPISLDQPPPLPRTLAPGSGPPLAKPAGAGFSHCPKCWSDASTVGSGNLKTDCWFVFSSSRAFFGEPCLPPPPGVDGKHHWFKFHDHH